MKEPHLSIEAEILKELPHFEIFFNRIGFKRIDGSVFGLLVLSKKPLTSEEIEVALNLSQSAVSLSLKTLTHFGAIETNGDRESRDTKARFHSPKEDSLQIVAGLFRKREEEIIGDFKKMAQRLLLKSHTDLDDTRKKRAQSIISTCEIAEAVIAFVITLAQNKSHSHYESHYEAIIKRLPKVLELLTEISGPLGDFTLNLKENLTKKTKDSFFRHLL